MSTDERSNNLIEVPLLPLRDVVVYPHMVIPLFVGRNKSIQALEAATKADKQILLVTQRESAKDDPLKEDIYSVGTLSNILQLLKLPDGTVKVLVEGSARGRIIQVSTDTPYFQAEVEVIQTTDLAEQELEALIRSLMSQFDQYVKLNRKVPPEILTSLSGIDEPERLVDTLAAHMSLKIQEKQTILEVLDLRERINQLMSMMENEIDLLQVEKRIRNQVKRQMEKSQREYYLNEQLKAIQKE